MIGGTRTHPSTMLAARFAGDRRVVLEERPVPVPGPGQVLVRVACSALCGSEREQYLHGYHHHQGHEVAGTVVEVGDGTRLLPGTRVALYLTSFCGQCEACRAGQSTRCLRYTDKENLGWAYPGGFAEYVAVREQNALPLDGGMEPWQGVLLLDTLGTPFHGLRLLGLDAPGAWGWGPGPRQVPRAAVLGCGAVGMGALLILRALGTGRLVAADVSEYRLEAARRLGAETVRGGPGADEELLSGTGGRGFDLVVEATGVPGVLEQALHVVAAGGAVLCLGELPDRLQLHIDLRMRLKDVVLARSWYFPAAEFARNQDLMLRGFFAGHEMLVTHRFPLCRVQEAADLFYGGEGIKVLVEPFGGSGL